MLAGKYAVFGAGAIGKKSIEYLGEKSILFFIDNSAMKQKNGFEGYEVYSLQESINKIGGLTVVIAVSDRYIDEIIEQLKANGVIDFKTFNEVFIDFNLGKINERIDYLGIYNKAISWIKRNTIEGQGIRNNSDINRAYPEVTGYYIPTLLNWEYRDLAIQYAKWLCDIQKDDGSWYDTDDKEAYVFDSAQILKGLIAIRDICPEVNDNIIRGCDWLVIHIDAEGRFHAVNDSCFEGGNKCSELIHIYALEPLVKAGQIYSNDKYTLSAKKSIKYYVVNKLDSIMDFNLVSHFYAYVMEGLVDVGEIEIAKSAMNKIALLQREDGSVPGYRDVDWVCSTGLFQLAIVWFKLGEYKRGNKAFDYACRLQNETGGWFGSYLSARNKKEKCTYFPLVEISWANKYFLDALYYRNKCLDNFE